MQTRLVQRASFASVLSLVLTSLALGCTTFHDELARGQRAFELNDHDRTLAILRDLEPDIRHLSTTEQAEYAYLRGMTDYRIGYRADARHWLSVARAMEESSPGTMPADWRDRTKDALGVLDDTVYTQGYGALTTSRVAADDNPVDPAAAPPATPSSPRSANADAGAPPPSSGPAKGRTNTKKRAAPAPASAPSPSPSPSTPASPAGP